MKFAYLLLLCLAGALLPPISGLIRSKLIEGGRYYVEDQTGAVKVFHGVNIVYKIPPYYPDRSEFSPDNSLTEQDIINLRNWGFNMVRLGVMWPGVMPTAGPDNMGLVNKTYLDQMEQIVSDLYKHGIYTLVDLHQDIASRFYCGEGIPDWAIIIPSNASSSNDFPAPIASPYPVDPTTKFPAIKQCFSKGFSEYYLSHRVGQTFQDLYDNKHQLQDQLATYWKAVVTHFQDVSGVLGYELINEPWAGDVYSNLQELLYPGYADKHNLQPMYDRLSKDIRSIDQDHLIFFESVVFDIFSNGFEHAPGQDTDRTVLSYHVYCLNDKTSTPVNGLFCDFVDDLFLSGRLSDLKRLNTAGFCTEFGAESNKTLSIDSLDQQTTTFDKYLQSWAYWQFKYYNDITTAGPAESFYDKDGNLQHNKVKVLSRSYAQNIAGTPTGMQFNSTNAEFNLQFNIDLAVNATTDIFLNRQYFYPKNFTVAVTPDGSMSYQINPFNSNILAFSPVPGKLQDGNPVTIQVKAN